MAGEKQPPLILKVLCWLFLVSLFGGGAVLFANLFGHFLPEAAFAIVALVIMAELVVLLIAGSTVRAISRVRALREAAQKSSRSK